MSESFTPESANGPRRAEHHPKGNSLKNFLRELGPTNPQKELAEHAQREIARAMQATVDETAAISIPQLDSGAESELKDDELVRFRLMRADTAELAGYRDNLAKRIERLSEVANEAALNGASSTQLLVHSAIMRLDSLTRFIEDREARMHASAASEAEAPAKVSPAEPLPDQTARKKRGAIGRMFRRNKNTEADAGKTPALPMHYQHDPVYSALAALEAKPQTYDKLRALVDGSFKSLDLKNKEIRKELQLVHKSLQQFDERMSKATEEEIKGWSEQILNHLDAVEEKGPMLLADEKNPYIHLFRLRDTPHLSQALINVMKKADSLMKVEEVSRFKSAATEIAQLSNILTVGVVTYLSWAFAVGGIKNTVLVGAPMIPGFETIAGKIAPAIESFGMQPRQVAYIGGTAAAYSASSIATIWLATNRVKKGFYKKWKFWAGLGIQASGAVSGIVEGIGEGTTGTQFAASIDQNIGPLADQIKSMNITLGNVEDRFIIGALQIGADEASGKDGKFSAFGPKSVGKLAALGLIDLETLRKKLGEEKISKLPPKLQEFIKLNPMEEFERFVTTGGGKNNAAAFRTELNWYLESIGKVNQMKRYKDFGFDDKNEMLQVLQRLFAGIDRESAPQALGVLRASGEKAKGATMWDYLASSAHLPHFLNDALGVRDVSSLFHMIGQKNQMMLRFGDTFAQYQKLRGSHAKTVQEYLETVARQSANGKYGLTFGAEIQTLLRFPALTIQGSDGRLRDMGEAEMEALGKRIITPELKTAIQILSTERGWQELSESLRRGGIDFPLDTTKNRMVYLFSVGGFYSLIDILPKFPVKIANAARARRFDRETSERYESINDVEHQLASEMVRHIDGYFKMTGNVLKEKNSPHDTLTPDVRIAIIRSRIRELADEEIPKNLDRWGVLADEVGALRQGTNMSVMESAHRGISALLTPVHRTSRLLLGYEDGIPKEVPLLNGYVRWLNSKREMLAKGDTEALMAFVGTAYPTLEAGMKALDGTLKHEPGSKQYRAALDQLRESNREMHVADINLFVPEITMQIELLKRGAHEVRESMRENKTTPGDPVYLNGSGNHAFSRDYINNTYVLSQIESDLERYTTMLNSLRAHGVVLNEEEIERIDQPAEELRAIVGGTASAPRSFDPQSAARSSLATNILSRINPLVTQNIKKEVRDMPRTGVLQMMRRRWGSTRESNERNDKRSLMTPMSERELATFVNELDIKLQPVLKRFQERVSVTGDPILAGRHFGMYFQYADAVEGPTISLVTSEKMIGVAAEDEIAWAPFADHHIPDFSRWRTPGEVVENIERWLEPNGGAERMLKTQLMGLQMKAVHAHEEGLLARTHGTENEPLRIPLTEAYIRNQLLAREHADGTGRFLSDELIQMGRLHHSHIWLAKNSALVRDANHGAEIESEELQRLSGDRLSSPEFPELRTEDYYAVTEKLHMIAGTLQALAELMPRARGSDCTFFYDPKPVNGPEIIIRREKQGQQPIEKRVRVGSTRSTLEGAIKEVRAA